MKSLTNEYKDATEYTWRFSSFFRNPFFLFSLSHTFFKVFLPRMYEEATF